MQNGTQKKEMTRVKKLIPVETLECLDGLKEKTENVARKINDIDVLALKEQMVMACEKAVQELINVASEPIITQLRQENIVVALNRILDYTIEKLESGDDSDVVKERINGAIKLVREKTEEIASESSLGSDKHKNAIVSKKLAMLDGFEIMTTIETERQIITDLKNGKSQRNTGTGLAESNARQTL